MSDTTTEEESVLCQNCGTGLAGPYCYSCGQKHQPHKHSFGHMMIHFIGDFFHFDSQVVHTLKPLFIKPGLVAKEYVEGKRKKHLDPIRMYVFVSIVFFAILFYTTKGLIYFNDDETPTERFKTEQKTPSQNAGNDPDSLSVTPESVGLSLSDSIKLRMAEKEAVIKLNADAAISAIKEDSSGNALDSITIDTSGKAETEEDDFLFYFDDFKIPKTMAEYRADQASKSDDERHGWFSSMIIERIIYFHEKSVKTGESAATLVMEALLKNLPKLLFVLLPVFALLLKLLYVRRNVYYVDHLVFMIYFYCFLYIISAVSFLNDWLIPWQFKISWIVFIWSSFYLYFAMRRFYEQSKWKTVLKFLLFGGMSVMVSLFFGLMYLFITFLIA